MHLHYVYWFCWPSDNTYAAADTGWELEDKRERRPGPIDDINPDGHMKRLLFCIPLLGFAPLGYFLGSYLSGLGTISWYEGFFIDALSFFFVPLLVPIVFVILYKASWIRRVILFIIVLLIQESVFFFVPARATAELMGIAHRVQREFSPNQLRDCADQLRTKFHAGTLKRGNSADGLDYFPVLDTNSVVIENTELPASLHGRFQHTFILTNPVTTNELVIFALDHETGLICGHDVPVPDYAYRIADGVEVYQDHP
jgi:hypothetical protein